MALTPSYVGTTTTGGSSQALATNVAYVKQVTIQADSVLARVEAFMNLTDGNAIGFRVGVWADNSGSPSVLVGLYQPSASVLVGATDRWFGAAVGVWFATATPVWVGVHVFSPVSTTLAYESTGGTDRTITTGSVWTGEQGALGTTVSAATTNDWSVRGLVIT